MGSTRLPGKVMLPLDGTPVIEHELRRASAVEAIDELVVATTTNSQDQILENYVTDIGHEVFRGAESDVLGRLTEAARLRDADIIIRLSGDNPLVPPRLIIHVLQRAIEHDLKYCSNKLERTLPVGISAEAIDATVLKRLEDEVTDQFYREHLSPYFEDYTNEFDVENIMAAEICSPQFLDVHEETLTELRLTLDRAPDYTLLRQIYEDVPYEDILSFEKSVTYIRSNGLAEINTNVTQEVL
jgi:spore coat polysaccharide biosynthesis protein SpsF